MPSTNEVISLVDAADTAVRTACVLELLSASRQPPPFAGEVMDKAMDMLEDAVNGSALLLGKDFTQAFSGNLDALCWATDSYIASQSPASSHPDPAAVEEHLVQVRAQMERARAWVKGAYDGVYKESFHEARKFFDALASILGQHATAALARPSLAQPAAVMQ